MTLRPYQQRSVDVSVQFMRRCVDPFLIEAATGAGKSHIIAEVASTLNAMSGKRILCLAPSAELVVQNQAKYVARGFSCSLFSASAGKKSLRHPVVFGTPGTVKNKIEAFRAGYAAVIIDECHGITPTVKTIIDEMRQGNPMLRVMGLTATPYRLGDGYIFRLWPNGNANNENQAKSPYFSQCVDRITAPELIGLGYLTPPAVGVTDAKGYDTSKLLPNSRGQFDAAAVDQAYHGWGRKTASIVADVVEKARNRKGVLIFAATVQHAKEIMESLPPQLSAMVTVETSSGDRKKILRQFLRQEIKYLVNVSVLTTGFDAEHVDVIALLRKTESVGLLQQMVGRGLRLAEGKRDCLVLDYTTNIEDHCPDGDLFSPEIQATATLAGTSNVEAECEKCGAVNQFSMRKDSKDYYEAGFFDKYGYCIDADGVRVETPFGAIPVHSGRRCFGLVRGGKTGEMIRCDYRWTSKECPSCEALNDIAARCCRSCKAELVDPNDKLREDFNKIKKDPYQIQTDEVVDMDLTYGVSKNGNETLRVDFVTPWRRFAIWLLPKAEFAKAQREWGKFSEATNGGEIMPRTVTYRKDTESGFYRALEYNQPADQEPGQIERGKAA